MLWLETHWIHLVLWAMWFSVTLGVGIVLWVRERKIERSSHNTQTCNVCAQFRHDQYIDSMKDPKKRLRLVKQSL